MDDVVNVVLLDNLGIFAFLGHVENVEFAYNFLFRLLEISSYYILRAASAIFLYTKGILSIKQGN
jgi:hypothetical protein